MSITDSNIIPVPRLTLRKAEKLRHRSLVNALFAEGKSFYDYPLRLTWHRLSAEQLENSFRHSVPPHIAPVQMLVTVPKRKRRHAVDRVYVRRRIREAYRLNRSILADTLPNSGTLSLAFIYLGNDNADFATIESKMKALLSKLRRHL